MVAVGSLFQLRHRLVDGPGHPGGFRLGFGPFRQVDEVSRSVRMLSGAGVSIDYTFQVKAKLPQLKKAGEKGKKS